MIKRLNFLLNKKNSSLDDKLDLNIGNYKDAIDFAITKCLTPASLIESGPYLGIVLRIDEPDTGTMDFTNILGSWIDETFGETSETGAPLPESLIGYKVRIPEMDACIPEPSSVCQNPQEDHEAQKWIEMHTTFFAAPDTEKAAPGQIVWVNFGDRRTKEHPVFLGPYFGGNGEIQIISPNDTIEGAKSAFDKCQPSLGGDPDGFSLKQLYNKYIGGDNGRNRFVGEASEIETEEGGSEIPKNTYPRECSLRTSKNVDNTPDNKTEEDNLKFLEEEVIPRLLPVMQEVDSRFVITSVYRSDKLNKKVGGHPNSFHSKGLAIDFGGLSGLKKDERDKIFIKAMDHLKKNKLKLPWLRTVIAELWRNHIHIDTHGPPQKSGTTAYRTWKLERLELEEF